MTEAIQPSVGPLRPRLGLVITVWTQEQGADYARDLVGIFPGTAPLEDIEIVTCPTLLESEKDIAVISSFFADKSLDVLCLVPGNFTLDHVMPLLAKAIGLPAIIWGLPSFRAFGAMIAAQQTLYAFKELGLPYRFVVGEMSDIRAWSQVVHYTRGAALVQRLKGLRVGLMGWRAQGMSDMTFDELALREVFGVQIVNVGLTRYERTMAAFGDEAIQREWADVCARFRSADLPDKVRETGMRSYLALRQIAAEEDLQSVTVECFPDHLGEPCLGCALLTEQGIAGPCEGDVNASVLMAAGFLLSGQPTFHVDIFTADLDANEAVMGHCGNLPVGLATAELGAMLTAARQFGAGFSGPIIQATMEPGPVTAMNLVGRRNNMRICALEGATEPYEAELPGSWARVSFPYDLASALEDIGNAGYGHHFVLVPGHVGEDLAEWSRLLDIEYMQPGRSDR